MMTSGTERVAPTVPRNDRFVYHLTDHTNLDEILQTGLTAASDTSSERRAVADQLETVAIENGLDYPFDREEAVYTHVDAQEVDSLMEDDLNDVLSPVGCAVIDLSDITAPLAIADATPATEMMDTLLQNPDRTDDGELENLAEDYIKSIRLVESWEEVPRLAQDIDRPELLIFGDVPEQGVVETVTSR